MTRGLLLVPVFLLWICISFFSSSGIQNSQVNFRGRELLALTEEETHARAQAALAALETAEACGNATRGKKTPAGLRTVAVPGDLISKFLEIAKVNSDRNIETLGTLGGQLCNNKFRVTHLLIPKQQGQSDSCTMDGIEDVWDIHDRENIIFLG